jgi:hypothetical protein
LRIEMTRSTPSWKTRAAPSVLTVRALTVPTLPQARMREHEGECAPYFLYSLAISLRDIAERLRIMKERDDIHI